MVVSVISGLALAFSAGSASAAVPMTYLVNSADNTDDGACDASNCTLREAMLAANANPGADNITFAGAYSIFLVGGIGLPLPEITESVNINTVSGPQVTLEGDTFFRIFTIHHGATVGLANLTLANGGGNNEATNNSDGGAIWNAGDLTLTGSTVRDNISPTKGGGIYNHFNTSTNQGGTLTVINSTIRNNTNLSGSEGGGGIHYSGYSLSIQNSTVSNNEAYNGGGIFMSQPLIANPSVSTFSMTGSFVNNNRGTRTGGGLNINSTVITVTDSTVSGNILTKPRSTSPDLSGDDGGGGMYLRCAACYLNSSSLTLTNITVSNNTTTGNGGGLRVVGSGWAANITNAVISGNTAGHYGGGMWINAFSSYTTPPTLTNSVFSGNQILSGASNQYSGGGGLYMEGGGPLTMSGLDIVNNSVNGDNPYGCSGGGVFVNLSTFTLANSTIRGNSVNCPTQFASFYLPGGGGIYIRGGIFSTLVNNTVSGNRSDQEGGGIYLLAQEGSQTRTTTLTGLTVTDNRSDFDNMNGGTGGGIKIRHSLGGFSHTVTLRSSIIADNYRGDSNSSLEDSIDGTATTASFNLIGTGCNCNITHGVDNNQVGVLDPGLGPLANNGGPTMTHALLKGSPAVDAGNSFGQTTDQRGQNRPYDHAAIPNASDGADIGAYEMLGALAASVSVSGRVMSASGRGVPRAFVTLTEPNGNRRVAQTNSFGYYGFDEVTVGEVYVFQAYHKQYEFAPQVLIITEKMSDLNFTADP